MHPRYAIGLMSGTSLDGIDAVLVDFSTPPCTILAHHYLPFSAAFQKSLLAVCMHGEIQLDTFGDWDAQLGEWCGDAVLTLLDKHPVPLKDIAGIGFPGQSLWHRPLARVPFTIQIGDPNRIAKKTNLCTVADFRRADLAVGGQGAPLVPAFHAWYFAALGKVGVLNIGGISNLTVCEHGTPTLGYDLGPGNALLDAYVQQEWELPFDSEGVLARQGTVDPTFLLMLKQDPYCQLPAPKSTGKDYFNLEWLAQQLAAFRLAPIDILATLTQFTADLIIEATEAAQLSTVLLCGGGAKNTYLVECLQRSNIQFKTTQDYGLPVDQVEAACFAWFAYRRLTGQSHHFPAITGADRTVTLGAIYTP